MFGALSHSFNIENWDSVILFTVTTGLLSVRVERVQLQTLPVSVGSGCHARHRWVHRGLHHLIAAGATWWAGGVRTQISRRSLHHLLRGGSRLPHPSCLLRRDLHCHRPRRGPISAGCACRPRLGLGRGLHLPADRGRHHRLRRARLPTRGDLRACCRGSAFDHPPQCRSPNSVHVGLHPCPHQHYHLHHRHLHLLPAR